MLEEAMVVRARVRLSSWCLTRLAWARLLAAKAQRRLTREQGLRVTRGRMARARRMLRGLLVLRLELQLRVQGALQAMWRMLRALLRRRLVRRATRQLRCVGRLRVHW